MKFDLTEAGAKRMDAEDRLSAMRSEFAFPLRPDGRPQLYLCGNSLGLMPKRTRAYVNEELDRWKQHAVQGHHKGRFPWIPYHEFLTDGLAALVGAKNEEVVAMNSLTVNLHLLMVSLFRPTPERYKVAIERGAFPSDRYAVESQLRCAGFDPEQAIIWVGDTTGEGTIPTDAWLEAIDQHAGTLALVLLPAIQYYTGQLLDIATITAHARKRGCIVGVDCAHAIGNVPLDLHRWDVDFAAWCHYKYVNSGPGAVGGCFVHERHAKNRELPRFAGWWGHDKATRFQMQVDFLAMDSAEGWQCSNPPILSLAAIRASLAVFAEAGGIGPLREKSIRLTGYLEALLEARMGGAVRILTPSEADQRGSQLSLIFPRGRAIHRTLAEQGIISDWREPDVMRVAPTALYNTFLEVWEFVDLLAG